MIDHTGVKVKDINKAKELYTKALATLGYKMSMDYKEAVGFMEGGHSDFWLIQNDNPQSGHVGFRVTDQAMVDSFYKEALAAGATDNGAPGYRAEYSPGYYAAFFLDADKNNIEAVWFDPSKEK